MESNLVSKRKVVLEEVLGTLKEGMLVYALDLAHGFKTFEEIKDFREFIKLYYSSINTATTNLIDGDIAERMRFLRRNAQIITIDDNLLILEILDSRYCKVLIEENVLYISHSFCRMAPVK